MSFIEPIKIDIWDGNDTSTLVGERTFESIDEEISIYIQPIIYDDFDDNSIDGAKWNETDSGSNINETNQRLEGKGNLSWNTNGIVSDISWVYEYPQRLQEWHFQIVPYNVYDLIGMFGPSTFSALSITGQAALLFIHRDGFFTWINGASVDTGYNWIGGRTYNCRIVYQNPGWKYYIQSPDHAAYSTEVEIASSGSDSIGSMYFHANFYTNGGLSYLDDVKALAYPTTSPSPAEQWNSLPLDSVVNMSTIRIPEVMNSVDGGSVEYQYAVGGQDVGGGEDALNGTWLTQTELKAEANPTITDATNSFKIVPQYISDGTQKTTSQSFAIVDVEFPEAVGGKYDKHAKYGHRRIGA